MKISTVQKVLSQVKEKVEALKNNEANLVIGNAIYCKLLDIMIDLRNLELHNFLNLQIGALHASRT